MFSGLARLDPDNNPVCFFVDWGDGSDSGWTKLYASEEFFFLEHYYTALDTYTVKVKAKYTFGGESDWTVHTMEITKVKPRLLDGSLSDLFVKLLEQFPFIARLLQI